MNKLKCYKVENLNFEEFPLVKVTTNQITYIDSNGKQKTENKIKSGASNTKLFEFRKDAIAWIISKHRKNIISSSKISKKEWIIALRMYGEFLMWLDGLHQIDNGSSISRSSVYNVNRAVIAANI